MPATSDPTISLPRVSRPLSFIDIFAGAGGLSLGLEAAGLHPLLAVDAWDDAVETFSGNFSETPVLLGDVAEITAATIARAAEAKPDLIVGGAPCQGFSTVGRRVRSDPRNALFVEFKRLVGEIGPKYFVLENVMGMRDMHFIPEVEKAFTDLGYSVTAQIVSAADFGVPQLRRRVLFVGSSDGRFFRRMSPCTPAGDHLTVWDAIGDLPYLGPGETKTVYIDPPFTDYQREMRAGSTDLQGHTASSHPEHLVEAISHIPDGGNRRDIPDHLQPRSGFHNSYSRLASWAPAVAVTSNMGKPSATRCIHPFQHRGLTTREGARLQTFPDRFHFQGGLMSQRLQVANAVPPRLASAIGLCLQDDDCWADGPQVVTSPEAHRTATEGALALG